jgi:hypothetical protein
VPVDPLLLLEPVPVDPLLLEPVPVDPLLLEPVLVPPSEAGMHGPQTPSALPGVSMQVSPGQQSALMVHLPHVGTQKPGPW